jgi:TatD DNase family protein
MFANGAMVHLSPLATECTVRFESGIAHHLEAAPHGDPAMRTRGANQPVCAAATAAAQIADMYRVTRSSGSYINPIACSPANVWDNAFFILGGRFMQLLDIGVNLGHESFQHDLDAVLQRAAAHGVSRMIVTGASRDGSSHALALAKAYPGRCFATAGVHPHHAIDYDDATDTLLRELALDPAVRAVGETGLDYNRNYSPRDVQLRVFERQLQIAVDLQKPLFLHQRDAHDDFLALLRRYRDKVPTAVVHCFTDSGNALRDYLALDCHIGITGWICDERRGSHLRELVGDIPANRLMIETDAPYLLPRTVRPQPKHRRNEPMYLRHICEEIARDRGESVDVTAANSTATAEAFFGLDTARIQT